MQITQTVSEGLRREYKIVIGAADLDARLTGRIEEMRPKLHLKGFRPGKAPVSYLKKTYRKSLMGEIVEAMVSESSQKAIDEHSLKPAIPPKVDLVSELENVVNGNADLEFMVKVDLMPDFEVTDLSALEVERLTAEVTDADIDDALERIARQQRTYTPRGENEKADNEDALTIDFVGRIGGEEFEGGKAEDFELVLGSGQFIPGFAEQLTGAKAGEERTVTVRFPADYGAEKLAGKEAEFTVKVKAVKKPEPVAIDEELAKKLGLESLNALKDRIREQMKADFMRTSRGHLKRRILDALDQAHDFSLPPAMVEAEFNGIWRAVEEELKREGKTPADEGKTEDELKAEYRAIAERRVRLGLVLARIGEQNGLSVSQDELNRALSQRARQFPGQEQQVVSYYANNPQALNEIRAPLFEEKVVDFIAELAKVTDYQVDRDVLFLDTDEAMEKLKDARSGDKSGKKSEKKAEKKPAKKKS